MKIALYLGGTSAERDVSLQSGKFIGKALVELGHEVLYVDPALSPERNTMQIQADESITDAPPSLAELEEMNHSHIFQLLLEPEIASCDFHFIGLHGGIGENGILQGMFEHLGYKFNGPGYSASALAMDKHLSKQLMVAQEIPTPEWMLVTAEVWANSPEKVRAHVDEKFTPPVVVKPNSQGSTIGLTIVNDLKKLPEALDTSFQYDNRTLVEQFIPGRELTVAILNNQAMPVIEIKPKRDLYDYKSKYTSGMSEYEVPAHIKDGIRDKLHNYSMRIFTAIGAHGYSRVDYRMSDGGEPFCLEVNTLPGMTNTSLVPKAAKAAGIEFGELLSRIIEAGRSK